MDESRLAPLSDLCGDAAFVVRTVENRVRAHMRGSDRQQLLLAVNQVAGIESGEFKSVAVGDGIGRTGFHAVSAKNAAVIVNVVDLGVALSARNADLIGVFRRFDVDAVGRAGGGAQKTGHTLFEAVFVALEDVHATEALLKLGAFQRTGAVGIVFHDTGLEHLFQGDGHALRDGPNILDDGHIMTSITDVELKWRARQTGPDPAIDIYPISGDTRVKAC